MDRVLPYNFGALPPLPAGYQVAWYECHEHYMATGPGEWEGSISVDPYWCRRQALWHSRQAQATAPGGSTGGLKENR